MAAPETAPAVDPEVEEIRTRAQKTTGLLCGLLPRVISDAGLENIATHKYQSGAYTALDNMLNPFWLAMAGLCPRWLAPNAITLCGLMCCVAAYALVVAETDTMEGKLTPGKHLACAVLIFLYQMHIELLT